MALGSMTPATPQGSASSHKHMRACANSVCKEQTSFDWQRGRHKRNLAKCFPWSQGA